LEVAVGFFVDRDGNLPEVHVHVAIGQVHPEAWRRWTRCQMA
jgi:predicted DNA-binding protein with PD1-like motif